MQKTKLKKSMQTKEYDHKNQNQTNRTKIIQKQQQQKYIKTEI